MELSSLSALGIWIESEDGGKISNIVKQLKPDVRFGVPYFNKYISVQELRTT